MAEDWLARWREGRTGWHEPAGNAALHRHWPRLPAGARVLVPLCGKAQDLLWLANAGCDVTGIELSPLAVAAFFADHALACERTRHGALTAWRASDLPLTLWCGDYFSFDPVHAGGPHDALYDRGALVALPPSERPAYVRKTCDLLAPAATKLVITLEYDQQRVAGPPFAVPGEELLAYWPGLRRVGKRNDIDNAPPKFRDAGLRSFLEVAWFGS